MLERTLGIIKPDAISRNLIGTIIDQIERNNLKIINIKTGTLTTRQAEEFYAEHREKSFFNELCKFMSSGRIVAMILEGENAIARYRELMGVTDPAQAESGTIRFRFGTDIRHNAVHGSDSPNSAIREIAFFF